MSKRVTAADVSLLDTSKHSFAKDVFGAISIVLVALPAVIPYKVFLNECSGATVSNPQEKLFFGAVRKGDFCEFGLEHPLWFLNALLFASFDVTFWIHSLLVDSTWIVDPYWTLACVLMGHFFQFHPSAVSNPRASLAMALLYIWAIRLTYSYFRREEWHFGVREDWRYAAMRVDPRLKKHWWWASFFLGFVFQHVLLFLACLPLYAVHFFGTSKGLNWQDLLGATLSIIGVVCEGLADTQLRDFMVANEVRARNGEPKVLLLDTGIWYYSRHPNYFGEQTFWWSLYVLANRAGRTEFFLGAGFMSLLFFGASLRMVEDRMLQNEARRKLFQEYMQTTSAFVPFFKFAKKQQ